MVPDDIQRLDDELDAAERDADALVAGVSEAVGTWRAEPGSWSMAECLDHLATANRVYVEAMQDAATRGRTRNKLRKGPAKPGLVGGWFVGWLAVETLQRKRAAGRIEL